MNVNRATKDSVIYRRVFRNAASSYADIAVTLGARFFLTPFMLNELGAAVFGMWLVVQTLTNYGRLFDFGISGAVTKYVAEDLVTGNIDRSRRLISTSLFLYTLIGLGVMVVFAAMSPFLIKFLHVSGNEHREATWFLILVGVWIGLSLPCSTSTSVLRGLQRYDAVNLIDIFIGTILPAAATVIVLLLGEGLVGLALVYIVSTILVQIPSIYVIYRFAPEVRFGWHGVDRTSIRTVATFGSWIFIGQAASRLQTKTDTIVIGAILSLSAVTPYAIALRLTDVGRTLVNQFLQVLMPVASELHAESDWSRLRALYITSTRLALAITIPIAGAFIIIAGPFLSVWVGHEYARYSYLVTILMLAATINLSQWPAAAVFQGMNRYGLLALVALISGVVNLGLSIGLGMRYGLLGVALGTLIPTVIENIGVVLPYSMRALRISVSDLIHKIVLPTFVPACPAAIILALSRPTLMERGLSQLAVITLASAAIYVFGYLGYGASDSELRAYLSLASNTMRFAETRIRRT